MVEKIEQIMEKIEKSSLEIMVNQGNLIIDLPEIDRIGRKIVLPLHFYPPQPFLCLYQIRIHPIVYEEAIPYKHTLSNYWIPIENTLLNSQFKFIKSANPTLLVSLFCRPDSFEYQAFDKIVNEAEKIMTACKKKLCYE